MNLVLGILWLLGAIGLFVYEYQTGHRPLRILGGNISIAWLALCLALYNFVRYYSARMGKADEQAMRIVHEARLRQARHRERPITPDPTFDFSDKPLAPPPPRGPTELPPSNN